MKNRLLIFLFLSLSANVVLAQVDSLQKKILQTADLQADFNFLRQILQETHPGLYRYTPKAEMQAKMDSIAHLLTKPMPFYEFYRVLAAFIADIRCAHTHAVPKKAFENYYLNEIKTFPFSVIPIQNQFFIALNGTLSSEVEVGSELLSINGKTMESIKSLVFRYLWADGYIESSKRKAFSEAYFPLFYYILVEQVDSFEIAFKNSQGQIKTTKILAQKWSETNKNFIKNPVNQAIIQAYKSQNQKNQKKGWRLEFLPEPKTALLTIRGFGGGSTEEEAQKKMRDFMNDCLKKIQAKKVENLIIDLRYNGGGWDIQGVELLTFLAKSPFKVYQRLHSITDSSEYLKFSDLSKEDLKNVKKELKYESEGIFSVKEEFSLQLKLQNPKPNRFTGKVYFLINGVSASTTSEFTAAAHSQKVGVLVGEETGGAYEGGNGGSFLHFELPHSKIKIGSPLLYYDNAVNPPAQKGRGTLPDYEVPINYNDVFKGIDTQLNFVLELIKAGK
jgi:C-terminal processing protease CtpA/Prc